MEKIVELYRGHTHDYWAKLEGKYAKLEGKYKEACKMGSLLLYVDDLQMAVSGIDKYLDLLKLKDQCRIAFTLEVDA